MNQEKDSKKKNIRKKDSEAGARTKTKLTIHKNERFFGPGICELLERIDETGSIQAAAKQMEMSYTKAWKILNRAEEQMGLNLITRVNGGKNGGSSQLTEDGKKAIQAFREMERYLAIESERLLEEYGGIFTGRTLSSSSG